LSLEILCKKVNKLSFNNKLKKLIEESQRLEGLLQSNRLELEDAIYQMNKTTEEMKKLRVRWTFAILSRLCGTYLNYITRSLTAFATTIRPPTRSVQKRDGYFENSISQSKCQDHVATGPRYRYIEHGRDQNQGIQCN
jgi:hypothetical protein